MSHYYRVTFIQRDGTPEKPTLFRDVTSANDYAASVNGTVEQVADSVGGAAASRLNDYCPAVKVCEPGTAELQREAARARFFADRAGEAYQPKAIREANREAAKGNPGTEPDMADIAESENMEDAFEAWAAKQGF